MTRLLRVLEKVMQAASTHSRLALFFAYTCLLGISYFAAYLLRFDFGVPQFYADNFRVTLPYLLLVELAALYVCGQFSILLGYFRIPDLYRIVQAMTLASAFFVVEWYINNLFDLYIPYVPRGIILSNFVITLFAIASFRLLLRIIREHPAGIRKGANDIRVAIVGAGDAGSQLAADMLSKASMRMKPVVFLDDDKNKWRRFVHGIPIAGSPDTLALIRDQYEIKAVIIAMPSAPARRIRDVVDRANELHLRVQTVPSLTELASGRVTTLTVRPVRIEDLLGRKPVSLDTDNIRQMIKDKVILVTGAGGSIGSELVRQIAKDCPSKLILVEQSEFAMFSLEEQLRAQGVGGGIVPIVANVRDEVRMREIISTHKPDAIFHAAAYKHVPIMERQPETAVVYNAIASAKLAEIASEYGVGRFVLVSTDKAINPTSAMGASKRLAELYIQALNYKSGNRTRFMAVRFGNVLDSSGSVVPIFRKQIEAGGPVTVTHPEVTRYFMTIPEAVGLVLQCGTMGEGGEIFVLDMGTPIKIVDMARQMIRMSGLRPDIDIEITYVGLRPGEKLYEELQHGGEHHAQTKFERIYRFTCEPKSYEAVKADFESISKRLPSLHNTNDVRGLIKEHVPEYTPYAE